MESNNPVSVRESLSRGEFDQMTSESLRSPQPEGCKIELKPHQLSALHSLDRMERGVGDLATRLGFYCDKVGAGKTYTILGHVQASIQSPAKEHEIAISYRDLVSHAPPPDLHTEVDVNIVVVPHSIIRQWQDSLKAFEMRSLVVSKKDQVPDCMERYYEYDIVVVTSTFYKYVHMQLCGYKVQRVFFDEADTLAIPRCERIMSHFYWFVSSSYKNFTYPSGVWSYEQENRIAGVRGNEFIKQTCLSVNAFPYLDRLFVKNEDSFVADSFSLPPPVFTRFICKTPSYLGVIGQFASPKVVECLHANDVKGAMQHLRESGINVDTSHNLLESIAKHYHVRITNLERTLEFVETLDLSPEEKQRRVARTKEEMDRHRVRLGEIQTRIEHIGDQTCPICYDELNNGTPTMLSCCNHMFCYTCMSKVASSRSNARCPMCRKDITPDTIRVIHNGDAETSSSSSQESLTKMERLRRILRNNPQGKFLVFSSHDQTFQRIQNLFHEESFRMAQPIGTVASINKRISEFRAGTVNVLLLNAEHLGAGLNLECTTHVIFFHKMNPSLETQVVGRAQRWGRTEPLQVIHLLHSNED